MLHAIKTIKQQYKDIHPTYRIVGGPAVESDIAFQRKLQELIGELGVQDKVELPGPAPYSEIEKHHQWCNIAVNMTVKHSLDTTLLEAMACGKPVVTTNEIFGKILSSYNEMMLCAQNNSDEMAQKIAALARLDDAKLQKISHDMREIIVKDHSLDRLIDRLVESFSTLKDDWYNERFFKD
ncbi:unnamed protein product, partial [marine sediment metagenome]